MSVPGDEAGRAAAGTGRPAVGGGGIIGRFARHPTAANLLLVLMIVAGGFALARLNTQFFPDFGLDVIAVTVEWPGATAEDVDLNIVQAIEPEVRFIDGVKKLRSTAFDRIASLQVEFEAGSDMQAALSDVESAVARVTTLPEDAERPEISRLVRYDTIGRLIVSGPFPEASLKAFAKRIRDDLLDRGIDKVDIFGTRDEEIHVEVAPETLRRLDLTLAEIAERIRETSQDLPSGEIAGGERQVRSLGLISDARAMAGVEVKALADGRKILLGDLATVAEAFEDGGRTARRLGQPAVELHVQRAVNADALELARTVDAYLDEVRPTLPPSLRLEQYDITANLIRDRVDLLIKNGLGGLVLVVAILFLFLNGRVAFWVAVGIPAALAATLAVMLASGQSINMVSLFGMIMAIGIVVDDAIVVGEHAEVQRAAGLSPLAAAIAGARRMAAPVFSSMLTTVAAFLPLFMITGIIGKIIQAIPLVVVAMLAASLVECFLVLPGHLRGALSHEPADGLLARFRRGFDGGFARLRDGPFRRLVEACVAWRYATLAAAAAAFVLALGLVAGGRVGFFFFPSPEADKIYANVELAAGSPRERTEALLAELERALGEAAATLAGPDDELVVMAVAKVGTPVGPEARTPDAAAPDTLGGLVVELETADRRTIRTHSVIEAWKAAVRPFPGLETLTIRQAQAGPPGREIDVRLTGRDTAALKVGAEEVKALLATYQGVSDIEDDLPYGKPETILAVTSRGRALGFTTESVGRQVRNAIEGAIAKRFPRADEEVTVRVQYPRAAVGPAVLDGLYLRSPEGREVPLIEAVARRESVGFARIQREDGRRRLAVTAEVDEAVTSTADVIEALQRDGLVEIARRHGLGFEFAGRAEEQAETFADMRLGALVGLAAIYIILAWVFASYARPLVVMAVIPLGFVGAVAGHWLLGFDLTILSLVALIGLAGIVINDSIILVTTVEERRRREPLRAAIVQGACDRLRAVTLTSATTIGGLTPLMFETSLQAQFLIPMALTLVSGLALTTLMVLVVVPALMAVQGDLREIAVRVLERRRAARARG